jgi:hypothetical protein
MGKLGVAPDGGQKTKGHSAFGAMAPHTASCELPNSKGKALKCQTHNTFIFRDIRCFLPILSVEALADLNYIRWSICNAQNNMREVCRWLVF